MQESFRPSEKEMGFSSATEGFSSELGGDVPDLEGEGNPEEISEMLAEELRQRLDDQISEIDEDDNAKTWEERFKGKFSNIKDRAEYLAWAAASGISATLSAGSAYNAVEALSQRDMGKVIFSVVGTFVLFHMARKQRKNMREVREQDSAHENSYQGEVEMFDGEKEL